MCTKIYSFESDFGADNYPNEFSWELLDSDTNILASKSNYVEQSKYNCNGQCVSVINNECETFRFYNSKTKYHLVILTK